MSRAIKFRAWDKENEEYINGYDVLLRCDGSAISRYALGALDTDMPVNAIIEQYTGLKDKNGKEIYEGDIIVFPSILPDAAGRYAEGKAIVKWLPGGFVGNGTMINTLVHKKCEVVGNIHENPELLGGGNEII